MKTRTLASVVIALALLPLGALAQSVEDFYRGRTLYLDIGLPPGGGYDIYARLLARFYGRFIPGNPTVVTRNMPGAGGAVAANHLYNIAPKDGSEIAMIASSAVLLSLFGDPNAKFEANRFTWLGSMNDDVASCGAWHTAPVQSFDEMFQKELVFGGSSPGAITSQHPLVFRNLLGAKAKLITGYQGTRDVILALQRGEVGGLCGLYLSSLRTQWRDDWKEGRLKVIIQLGTMKNPGYGDVPNIFEYAKTDEQRQVMTLIFGQSIIGRPLLAPPGLPPDRRDALRQGLMAALKDPELRAEAERIHLEVDPVSAERIDKLLAEFYAYPKAIIEKAKEVEGLGG